jgi:O-methyltransferase
MINRLHDLDDLERAIYAEVSGQVAQSPESIAQTSRAVRYLVENDIYGDFVECGVFMGASIIAMIRTLGVYYKYRDPNYARPPHIWLYDTFEGMPEQNPELDVFHDPAQYPLWDQIKRDDGSGGSNWVHGPIDAVRANVNRTGYPQDRLGYVKGMVEQTLPKWVPDRIALLRLDTDYYSSTKHELTHLYPRVVSGGVIIIDDYGAFKGCKQAVDEYIRENGLKVLLSRIDEHVRMWVKP